MINAPGVLAALAGAVTTGVIGNYLLQRWQKRSWFAQQRQLFHQQELDELKQLYDDITEKAEGRLTAMRRLLAVIHDGDVELAKALEDYRTQLAKWNSSLRSFYPRITLHYSWAMTLHLENEIHGNFVALGRSLEGLVRTVRTNKPPLSQAVSNLSSELNLQAGRLSHFYESLANGLEKRRDEVLNGKRHTYLSGAFHHFTISDLIKALFASEIDRLNVVRPAN